MGFDQEMRQVSIRGRASNAPETPTSDIGQLSTLITTIVGLVCPGVSVPPTPTSASLIIAPVTPTHNRISTVALTTRFLIHGRDALGIVLAPTFEVALQRLGYGPDIIDAVPTRDLVKETGMTPGDALRLKRESPGWCSVENHHVIQMNVQPEAARVEDSGGSGNDGQILYLVVTTLPGMKMLLLWIFGDRTTTLFAMSDGIQMVE